MKMKTVEASWKSNNPPMLYCPACGKPVTSIDDDFQECEHILFTYLDITDGFMYMRKQDESRLQELQDENAETGLDLVEEAMKLFPEDSIICIKASTSTISGCGPTGAQIVACIDFAAGAE